MRTNTEMFYNVSATEPNTDASLGEGRDPGEEKTNGAMIDLLAPRRMRNPNARPNECEPRRIRTERKVDATAAALS